MQSFATLFSSIGDYEENSQHTSNLNSSNVTVSNITNLTPLTSASSIKDKNPLEKNNTFLPSELSSFSTKNNQERSLSFSHSVIKAPKIFSLIELEKLKSNASFSSAQKKISLKSIQEEKIFYTKILDLFLFQTNLKKNEEKKFLVSLVNDFARLQEESKKFYNTILNCPQEGEAENAPLLRESYHRKDYGTFPIKTTALEIKEEIEQLIDIENSIGVLQWQIPLDLEKKLFLKTADFFASCDYTNQEGKYLGERVVQLVQKIINRDSFYLENYSSS